MQQSLKQRQEQPHRPDTMANSSRKSDFIIDMLLMRTSYLTTTAMWSSADALALNHFLNDDDSDR